MTFVKRFLVALVILVAGCQNGTGPTVGDGP